MRRGRYLDLGQSRRYLVVGGLCAVLNIAILVSGEWIGVHYLLSNVAAFVITSTIAFVLHTRRTFKVSANLHRYLRFMTGLLSAFVVSTMLYFVIFDAMGVPMPIASPIITTLILCYNFIVARISLEGGDDVSHAGLSF